MDAPAIGESVHQQLNVRGPGIGAISIRHSDRSRPPRVGGERDGALIREGLTRDKTAIILAIHKSVTPREDA